MLSHIHAHTTIAHKSTNNNVINCPTVTVWSPAAFAVIAVNIHIPMKDIIASIILPVIVCIIIVFF